MVAVSKGEQIKASDDVLKPSDETKVDASFWGVPPKRDNRQYQQQYRLVEYTRA